MGVDKSEVKMAVAHELGAGFDDALESAQHDIYRWDGAKTSLRSAAQAVEGLIAHAKRDMDAEILDEEQFVLVRKWLQRSAEVVRNMRIQADVKEQRAHGRVEALQTSVKITKKLYDDEQAKRQAVSQHTEEEPDGTVERLGPPRPTGTRPPNRIAALKAAENGKKSEKKSKKKSEKKPRKCSRCDKEGHTVRTCKEKPTS